MTRKHQHDRMLLEAARQACLQAAADACEDAGIRGLCGDGRWEYALGAIRALDLEAVLTSTRSSAQASAACDRRVKSERGMQIERGGQVPHVVVRGIDGTTFSYGDIWQRRNLLLVTLASEAGARQGDEAACISALLAHDEAFQEYETTVVITRDAVAGLPPPALLIADRWGEIITLDSFDGPAGPPPVAEILEWLRFVAHSCPECEGESK